MGGKVVLTLAVVVLIWVFWKSKKPVPTPPLNRFFRALAAAKAAMEKSARARAAAEMPPQPQSPPAAPPSRSPQEAIDLVRCPKCGSYVPAGQTCSCSS